MIEALSQLPVAHQAYLATVIAAFSAFGATLAIVHGWSNAPVRTRDRRPAAEDVRDLRPLQTARLAA